MTPRPAARPAGVRAHPHRFRLSRAGILNVWQYDDQVFEFADGRLLLRGANGAGKSKTLEMLLPFVLDGDKLRMTASGRHHTSLLWLMTDGYDGAGRVGYLWVEFVRTTDDGDPESFTCGVGIRASQTARTASTWYFTSPRRVGEGLLLEDGSGPLSRERCRAAVEADGRYFESPRQYKQHVGETLFGLAGGRYDELLRLLYWLRQPQVGEDVEPGRLAEILSVSLPELDDQAVRAAGGTLDELAAFGEQLARRRQAAAVITSFARLYADYARGVVANRGSALVGACRELGRLERAVGKRTAELAELAAKIAANEDARAGADAEVDLAGQRLADLKSSPEARSHHQVMALGERAGELASLAGTARGHATTARNRADEARQRADRDAGSLRRDARALAEAGQSLAAGVAALGVRAVLAIPAGLAGPELAGSELAGRMPEDMRSPEQRLAGAGERPESRLAESLAGLDAALARYAETVAAARPPAGQRQAEVRVVDQARQDAEQAEENRRAAEGEAARLENDAEAERARLAEAELAARAQEESFAAALTAWRNDDRAVATEIPDELTAEVVQRLGAMARETARPRLDALVAAEAGAGSRREVAEQLLARLHKRRAAIDAEPDPAPEPPALGRSVRDGADGAPLWRLVDFAGRLGAGERAGLEAALESAGLLDAWVRVDGQLLGADQRDVVLPTGPAFRERSLAGLLVADPPAGCLVTAETIRGVLGRITAAPATGLAAAPATGLAAAPATGLAAAPAMEPAAVVGPDGCWRLGPLTGRAAKPTAQYIGATARKAERARRLAEVGEQLTAAEESRREAAAAEEQARGRRESIEAWLGAAPPFGGLLTAWANASVRAEAAARVSDAARVAEHAAKQARATAVTARRALGELAAAHDLPVTRDGLAAHRERLRELDATLAGQGDKAGGLRRRLARFGEDVTSWAGLDRQACEMEAEAAGLEADATAAARRHQDLRRVVEASVRELEERLQATRAEITAGKARVTALRAEHDRLVELHGSARQALADTSDRRAAQEPVVVEAAQAAAELVSVPGLLASAGALEGAPPDVAGSRPADGAARIGTPSGASEAGGVYELARGVTLGSGVPAAVVQLAGALAGLRLPERPVSDAAVWNRYTEVTSGPAADCEPRVLEYPGMLAVVGRDEAGERPLGDLASRLTAAADRDAELLTERERKVFEEHILGDLGDALRTRRQEAEELVAAMNRLLDGVTTSQGVRVSLHWRLRDDVPGDSRQAVALLGRPLGALLPDERQALRDCLHRLIEASRSEQPELSYAEHLGRALDYRQWFAFRVRYTRPELDGRWLDLHRRSPLSQGEQKVVCYLPLFAAAAAHFSSVAGAAPHAPRFVLLDDAFPKIDVRTHPLLFGLLVDLDLDFLITSERLWGDHETVPALAIYEALRDPSERGIAQYQHRWDGQRLHAVGA